MAMAPSSDLQIRYQQILKWLNLGALESWDVPSLQAELIDHLQSFGMQIYRMHIGMPMLHPLYSVGAYNWLPDRGVVTANFHRGFSKEAPWLQSPIRPFYEDGSEEGYIKVIAGQECDRFPILKEAARNGATDYFLQLTNFPDRGISVEEQEGVVLSWISSSPDGFSEDDLSLLRMIRLPLCAQLKNLTYRRLVDDILDAYLGSYSGKRVHDGQFRRGDGDVIDAVIFFCDLRNSSRLAEHYDLNGFLAVLNDYYEVTAGAVIEGGGEVLRYIGDASLAIFPLERYENLEEACASALRVAERAEKKRAEVNQRRFSRAEPPIEFGIGLHVGTVMYGNIGTPERIEFTVIGQAANEAARIESLCRELGRPVLVSDTFAEAISKPWQSEGSFELRKFGKPIEVFSPA